MTDTLHEAIIERACRRDGWHVGGWKKAFLAKCRANPSWCDEVTGDLVQDLFAEFRQIPDAWRLVVEDEHTPGMDWNHPVLVLELLEVEISHPMSLDKRRAYVGLWHRFDGSDHFHLRIYRAERYQPPMLWLDFDTIHDEMAI
jgi:hypothetical protein